MTVRSALRALTFVVFVLVSGEVLGGVQLQSFGITPPGTLVFATIGPSGAPGLEAGPGATIAWPVTVDFPLLEALPATLQVNLPDRPSIAMTRMRAKRRGPNMFMWSGSGSDCTALFDMFPDGLKGTISCIRGQYGLDHGVASTNLRLTRYDNSGSPFQTEPMPGFPRGVTDPPPAPPTVLDTTVDVLVLFNGTFSPNNIWRDAQIMVDQTQTALDRSKNPTGPSIMELTLSGAARISRTNFNDLQRDLAELPLMPEVQALRNYWAADAVVYITTGDGPVQGTSNVPGDQGFPMPWNYQFAPYAYSVVQASHATVAGDYVFAHEFAHNFGANHNPDHLPANPNPVRPWAFGHWSRQTGEDVPVAARTIMAYVDECIHVINPCPRIIHYSNPSVVVDGWFQTGVANVKDNVRLMYEIAPIEAQYRPSVGRIFAHGFQ